LSGWWFPQLPRSRVVDKPTTNQRARGNYHGIHGIDRPIRPIVESMF